MRVRKYVDNFAVDLNTMDLLRISGEDNQKFLQGQLTCDLSSLAAGQSILGAACTNKGRVYSSFRIARLADDYYLSLQPGVMAITTAQLKKYIPFYKATLQDAAPLFNRLGMAGKGIKDIIRQHFPVLPQAGRISEFNGNYLLNTSTAATDRFEAWLVPEEQQALYQALTQALITADPVHWRAIDHAAGIFTVTPDDVELYTPEELNFDVSGHVSFDKGCYTGQEIVARMHYRGKAKKRLYRIAFASGDAPLEPRLLDNSGNTLGIFSNLLKIDNKYQALAVLKTDVAMTGSLSIVTETGKIPVTVSQLC